MATVAELVVRVGARTEELERAFARSTRTINAFADGTERVGASLTRSVTLPILALGTGIAVATAKMDSLQRGLVAVAGSTQAAQVQLVRLTEIAKAPGIGFAEAIQGSTRLQSIGFSAALAERSLKAFANAIALTGGGRDELARVNVQLGQLASKGKVLSQDIRPIIENAPAFGRALREAFGTIDTEAIQKLGLTTSEFLDRVLTRLEALPKVTGGLANSFENLKDAIFRAFAGAGIGQASALGDVLNSLARKVEFAGRMFASLPPSAQRSAFVLAAIAAVAGPLVLAISALSRAFVTLQAVSLVAGGIGLAGINNGLVILGARLRTAIISMRAATAAAGTLTVAWRGLSAALTGPVGLTLALGAVAAAFINTKLKAQEAAAEAMETAEEFRAAISAMNEAALNTTFESANRAFPKLTQSLERERQNLERLRARVRAGESSTQSQRLERGPPVVTPNALGRQIQQAEQRVQGLEDLVNTRKSQLDALALEFNARIVQSRQVDLLGGAAATEAGDKFKALREQVEALAALLGTPGGIRYLQTATSLESNLQRRVDNTNQSLQDRADLLRILQQLQGGLSAQVDLLGALPTERLNQGLERGTIRPADTANVALNEAARLTTIMERGFGRAGDQARRLARFTADAARYIRQMTEASGLARSLAGVAAQFGRIGEEIADILDRVADLTDALAALRESQSQTGERGLFANLSNLTGALGVLSAGIGLIGNAFARNPDVERRERENTTALNRLSSQLNRMSGSAGEFRRASLAVGALSRDTLNLVGNPERVNQIIAQFGLTLGDLNRLAQSLGIDILTENGNLAVDALDELAEALGYNTALITRFGQTMDDARRVQDARNRIFNVEVTPQVALNQAVAELGRFAPLLSANVLRGVNLNTAAGREKLQKAIQDLFNRMSAGGINIGELGLFQDVNQLLESILGIDDALDRFRETTEGATAAMLNVPQGFKVALAAFNATQPTPPPPAPPSQSSSASIAASTGTVATFAAGAMPIQIITSGDGRETYRQLYEQMQAQAAAHPSFQSVANLFPSPN